MEAVSIYKINQKVKNILKNSQVLTTLFCKFFNKLSVKGNSINFTSINFKNNEININGLHNEINLNESSIVNNSRVNINGNENLIEIKSNVEFTGDLNRKNINIIGNNNKIIVEPNSIIRNINIFISGDYNFIHIKDDCSITFTEIHMEQNSNSCIINNGTTTHGREFRWVRFELDEGTKIDIGNDCMISNDVIFRTSDSHSIVNESGLRVNKASDIIIGSHCWFGLRSLVLKGTKISDNVIIGAGSICTKSIKENNVSVAGNPAKIIKENIDWNRKYV